MTIGRDGNADLDFTDLSGGFHFHNGGDVLGDGTHHTNYGYSMSGNTLAPGFGAPSANQRDCDAPVTLCMSVLHGLMDRLNTLEQNMVKMQVQVSRKCHCGEVAGDGNWNRGLSDFNAMGFDGNTAFGGVLGQTVGGQSMGQLEGAQVMSGNGQGNADLDELFRINHVCLHFFDHTLSGF